MSTPAEIDASQRAWVDQTLGADASPALKRILFDTVCDGGWWLDSVEPWQFTIIKILGDKWESDRLMVRVHCSGNRFRSAEVRRIVHVASYRRLTDLDTVLS